MSTKRKKSCSMQNRNVKFCFKSCGHMIHVHNQGDKPKKVRVKICPTCQKEFKNHSNLKEHILVKHENKRDHHCDQCTQSFGTLNILRTHKRNVHNRVRCEECGKESYNSFALKRHLSTAHGIKPKNVFHCHNCPLFFSSQSALVKHIVSKHP